MITASDRAIVEGFEIIARAVADVGIDPIGYHDLVIVSSPDGFGQTDYFVTCTCGNVSIHPTREGASAEPCRVLVAERDRLLHVARYRPRVIAALRDVALGRPHPVDAEAVQPPAIPEPRGEASGESEASC